MHTVMTLSNPKKFGYASFSWNPFFDLVDDFWARTKSRPAKTSETPNEYMRHPVMQTEETPDAFEVSLDVPGIVKDDLRISVDAGVLRVEGMRTSRVKEADHTHAKYVRSFAIPETVDVGASTATLVNGVLTLRLSKTEPAKSRVIEISDG